MTRRRRTTPEQAAADAVEIATILDDVPNRLAFNLTIARLQRGTVASLRSIAEGDYHRTYASRGERWSDTYALRRAEERLAETEAVIAALEGLR